MAILDPDMHPPLELFPEKTLLIAYLSAGEAESYRSYWNGIKDKPWVLKENLNWKNNYFVDVRNPEWHELILSEVIPGIIQKGFRGIFLDTLDTAETLESEDSAPYAGARKAMIRLVQEIRKKYPDLLLISNNGFAILSEIAPFLDGMLAESVCSTIDFEKGTYRKNSEADRMEKTVILRELAREYALPVFVVDYVSAQDESLRRECRDSDREEGFSPYIARKERSELYE